MKKLKKIFLRTFIAFVGIYILTCGLLYFMQEKIIFFPKKLTQNYKFQFDGKFEELNIITADKIYLNGLLFKSAFGFWEPGGIIIQQRFQPRHRFVALSERIRWGDDHCDEGGESEHAVLRIWLGWNSKPLGWWPAFPESPSGATPREAWAS